MAHPASLLLPWIWVPVAAILALTAWTCDVVRAATGTVSIVDFAFQPTPITVNVGDTVTWTNNGSFAHTTTSSTALWDSGPLAPGQSFSHTFTAAGTYAYVCMIHPFMQGSVTVMGSAPPTGPAVRVTVARVGTNRLQVTITARTGETLQRLAWTVPANAAAEALDGSPLPAGVALPAGSTSAAFYLRRVSGQSVTLPIVVTGSFGTWRTFVGGGPNAW